MSFLSLVVGTLWPCQQSPDSSRRVQDQATKEKALQTMSSMSSAQIVSATAMHQKGSLGLGHPAVSYPGSIGGFWQGGLQAGTSHEWVGGGERGPPVTSESVEVGEQLQGIGSSHLWNML